MKKITGKITACTLALLLSFNLCGCLGVLEEIALDDESENYCESEDYCESGNYSDSEEYCEWEKPCYDEDYCGDWDEYGYAEGYGDGYGPGGYGGGYAYDGYGSYGYDDGYGYDGYGDGYDSYGYGGGYGGGYGSYGGQGSFTGTGENDYPYDTNLGTAKELDGKIAIISIFIDDDTTGWDFGNNADLKMQETVHKDLQIATDYLEDVSKDYGHNADFIYDWNQYPELFYELSVNIDYRRIYNDYDSIDYTVWDALTQNVPTPDVLVNTGTEQAIYMLYFNTPKSNTITSCTRNFYEGMEYPYEMCYMFMNCEGETEPPACFAHEMLHTFGAPDLYQAAEYGITQQYVDYVEKNNLNDLMRICHDPKTNRYVYDRIVNEVTDITAYYAGLTDYSKTVDDWGFEPSQH